MSGLKRAFKHLGSTVFGDWASPPGAPLSGGEPLERSDSLQSLNRRAINLDIGTTSGARGADSSRGQDAGAKRAKIETIELSDSDTDDSDIVVVVEPDSVDNGKGGEERENLGSWWNDVEMNKRREQFLLANADLYSSLLPNDTGYFAKLRASHRQTGDPFPTTPAIPYRRLSQPTLIAKDAVMKDYQLSGLSFLAFCAENRVNAILADEMGLGKTLQTLSLIAYLAENHGAKGPHLLLCPLSVLSSWMGEIARWLPGFTAMRFHGTQPARALMKDEFHERAPDLVVATYESYTAEQVFFKNRKTWGLCVLDEGHKIKNSESLVSLAIRGIRAQMRIILSGTPVQNNLVELWSLLHFLDPLVFHDRTVQPFKSSFDLTLGTYDQRFLRQSQQFLELVMLRRTKEGVSSQLTVPPREEYTIYVPLSPAQRFWTQALLARTEADVLADIFSDYEAQTPLKKRLSGVDPALGAKEVIDLDAGSEADDAEAQVRANVRRAIEASKKTSTQSGGKGWTKLMNLLIQLRKTCNHPYLLPDAESEPFEVAEHIVAASSKLVLLDKLLGDIVPRGEKVLIFSGFTGMLDILEDFMHLRNYKYCRLDGGTSRPRRTLDIRLFQQADSPYQVYLISTKAGGLGINLTAASTVVIFDQDWNPQVDLQAIARAHRIGQAKTVKVYKLVAQDSVEEQMLTRLRKKLYLSAKVMGSMRNLNERARAAAAATTATGTGEDDPEVVKHEEEAPKMTRGELAGILRGGAGILRRWTNSDGSDPFETFKASTFDEIIERGKVRDETKEVGIKVELGGEVELSEEQRRKLEQDEEEAEAVLLAGREAVKSRQFEGKMFTFSNKDIRQEWQKMQGKQARLDKSRTVMVDGFAISKESINNGRWEAVKTITSDPSKLEKLRGTKRATKQFEHEDWCVWCRDGGKVYTCRSCPRVTHGACSGLSRAELKGTYMCPQHNCYECGKTTAESGGLLFRCQLCPMAFCEDCLPPGDLESVGDVLPELLILGYGKNSTAHFIRCNGCIEHWKEHPKAEREWRKEQDKIEKKARKMGYDF